MNYQLRRCLDDDYDFCYRITKQNMNDYFCRHWGGWVDEEFRKGFLKETIQIIVVDQRDAGLLSTQLDAESAFISSLQLAPEFQRLGIGTQVLRDFIAQHPKLQIDLCTFVDNPAQRLYSRLGFVVKQTTNSLLRMSKPGLQS